MKLSDAKMEFAQTWGTIGSAWGIPRSMAQIHALLLANKEALSTEDVMETLQLSREMSIAISANLSIGNW